MHAGILIRSFAVELQEQLRGSRCATSDFIKEREERLLQLIKELTSLISLQRQLSVTERERGRVDLQRDASRCVRSLTVVSLAVSVYVRILMSSAGL